MRNAFAEAISFLWFRLCAFAALRASRCFKVSFEVPIPIITPPLRGKAGPLPRGKSGGRDSVPLIGDFALAVTLQCQ